MVRSPGAVAPGQSGSRRGRAQHGLADRSDQCRQDAARPVPPVLVGHAARLARLLGGTGNDWLALRARARQPQAPVTEAALQKDRSAGRRGRLNAHPRVRMTPPVTPEAYARGRREGDGGATAVAKTSLAAPARTAALAVLALTLVAYVALALGYATLTPIWENPDEPAHYNYVAFVAETGGLPTLQPGDWDSALLDRLKNGRLQPGDSVGSIRYEAWQPPLFYLAAAPLFRLGPVDDPAVQVFRLRAFDIVIGALTLGIAFLTARALFPPHLAAAVPIAIVGIPMFTAVSAAISADPLANLLSASLLLVLVRRIGRDRTGAVITAFRQPDGPASAASGVAATDARGSSPVRRSQASPTPLSRTYPGWCWPVGAGALLGLGLLTKLALAIFVPLALLVLLVRSSRPIREGALLLCTSGLVVLPWLVHQVTTYGWTDPLATSRHAAVVLDQQRFPGLSLTYVGDFLTITFHSFWAQFGWMAIVAPARLYWIWGLALILALGGLGLARRRLYAEPAWRLVLATIVAAGLGYIGYNLTFEQFQGRYLFTALVPIGMLFVLGWAAWLPRRVQSWGLVLIGAGLVGLNAYALVRVLVPGFAPTG